MGESINLKEQSEMFNEFKAIGKKKSYSDLHKYKNKANIFNINYLKETKIELSLDILVVLFMVIIMLVVTCYFIGVQKGKKIGYQNENIVTTEITAKVEQKSKIIEDSNSMASVKKEIIVVPENKKIIKENTSITINTKKEEFINFKYTIQIGASKDKKAAEKEIRRLKDRGYESFIIVSKSSRGKNWYKLCIGRFKTVSDASLIKKELKEKLKYKDCFLTRL